jgi:hypothetical protein
MRLEDVRVSGYKGQTLDIVLKKEEPGCRENFTWLTYLEMWWSVKTESNSRSFVLNIFILSFHRFFILINGNW